MGRREEPDLRSGLLWAHLLVNDVDGDAYEGTCIAYDDNVLILETAATVPLRFHPRDGSSPREIDDPRLIVPAARVKFSTVKAPGVPG